MVCFNLDESTIPPSLLPDNNNSHTNHHSAVQCQHIHSLFHIPVVKMADTTNVDASKVEETKVDATPAAEDKKVDAAPASETVQADQAAPVAPAEPEPSSNATATEEKATTADPPKEEATGSTEAAAPAPAATEAKADEAKPAEEKKEAAKGEGEAETKPEEAAAAKEKDSAAATKEATPKKTPFEEFDAKVADILKEVDHDEMWGVKLVTPASSHVPTQIVIQKFLNANDGDLTKSVDQFKGALKFRKEKKPLELIKKTFSASKFGELGAVTVYAAKDSSVPEVFTWNLYGNVKGKIEEAFTPLEEYVELTSASSYFKPALTDTSGQVHGVPNRPAGARYPAAQALRGH